MATPPNLGYLRAFSNSFSLVGIKNSFRMREALTDSEAGTYTFERASGDMLAFYNDLIAAWFGIASGTPVVLTPSVTIKIAKGTANTTVTVPLELGAAALDCTDLFKIGAPPAPKVPKADVTLTLVGKDLQVDLKNLGAVTEGLYQGQVFVAATLDPVLEIQLLIV